MKSVLPAIAILASLFVPEVVQAQFYSQDQLDKVEEIFVLVEGDVVGDCLPTPNLLKIEAEMILRRSGITVTGDKYGGPHILRIVPTGDAVPTGSAVSNFPTRCIGRIDLDLTRFEVLSDQTVGLVLAAQYGSVLIGPKFSFQKQLQNTVNVAATAFANEILKVRAAADELRKRLEIERERKL